jgi:hypothetical protein
MFVQDTQNIVQHMSMHTSTFVATCVAVSNITPIQQLSSKNE